MHVSARAQVSTLLLVPICPHSCEHVWRDVLGRRGSALTAGFPAPSAPPDFALKVLHCGVTGAATPSCSGPWHQVTDAPWCSRCEQADLGDTYRQLPSTWSRRWRSCARASRRRRRRPRRKPTPRSRPRPRSHTPLAPCSLRASFASMSVAPCRAILFGTEAPCSWPTLKSVVQPPRNSCALLWIAARACSGSRGVCSVVTALGARHGQCSAVEIGEEVG